MNDDRVAISIDIEGYASLEVGDVWPDGDAPDVITADAIKAVMEECGDKRRVLDDWSLLEGITVTVVVRRLNPSYSQDEVLFGDTPPRALTETAEVWEPGWRLARRKAEAL